jgi:hypothetical protein
MRLYTVHAAAPRAGSVPVTGTDPDARPPVLVREGFAVWAFLLGPVWFLANRLWVEALALLALTVAALLLLPGDAAGIALLALAVLAGMEGRDRLRARLARQGLPARGVIAAESLEFAWFRLGQQRPDLVRALP